MQGTTTTTTTIITQQFFDEAGMEGSDCSVA